VIGRHYVIPLREVAAAFIAVGQGASYAMAGDRARGASGLAKVEDERGGQLVAEWLDSLAPVIVKASAETAWPRVLVLDSTRFMHRNGHSKHPKLAFNVLGAYGYPGPNDGANLKNRLWALSASHSAGTQQWVEFLRQMDTTVPPEIIITDADSSIASAVRKVWPTRPVPFKLAPYVFRCEHHLHKNAKEKLEVDIKVKTVRGFRAKVVTRTRAKALPAIPWSRLSTAFLRTEGWEEFKGSLTQFPATRAWVAGNDEKISAQVAVRHLLDSPRSTGALDTHLGRVRDFLDSRTFVLRNAKRLNQTLGLMRLHLNGTDYERDYLALLRKALDQANGWAPKQRTNADPKGKPPSLRR
jgi:hypothetical protein